MNRLWVRFALVIAGVMLFIVLLPITFFVSVKVGAVPEPESRQGLEDIIDYIPPDVQAELSTRIELFIERYFVRSFVTISLLGILAGVLLSRSLTSPLQELETGAKAIASQDLAYRVPERGSQEIMAVAHSFNQMAGRLQQAETLRRNLLADVAHELRHPLHVLQGNLQAILDGVYPLQPEEIARLLDQTQHLTTLVNDLHELALAEAQQLPMHKQMTDMAVLVKDTAVTFKSLAAEQKVELRIELLGAPPQQMVDPARIRQAVNNLLNNALTHTPAGGTVTVSVQQTAEGCEICVRDTGAGIDPAQTPYVFDRFYRADSARSRDNGGVGLGLAIVQAIAGAHEGQVTVSSAGVGQGSTFVMQLPKS
ncbi:MAG: HAMP domain-containing protein [Ardenticatenaceae bacterium]|nr:HAMP domain-containing protein [Anaerolineales bacterium]MCB8920062.1 HAMP domain-containing protein [Ardenticatenaceae bacterium]MCB8989907.1 HAMP domain-containing protein [Ardenticatenaceae bacterium]